MRVLYKKEWFQLIFAWYDLWIGFYYDIGHHTLYVILIPMLVFRFQLPGVLKEDKHRQGRYNL